MDIKKLMEQQRSVDEAWTALLRGDTALWEISVQTIDPEALLKYGEDLLSTLPKEVAAVDTNTGDCLVSVVHDRLRSLRDRCRVAANPREALILGFWPKPAELYNRLYIGMGL